MQFLLACTCEFLEDPRPRRLVRGGKGLDVRDGEGRRSTEGKEGVQDDATREEWEGTQEAGKERPWPSGSMRLVIQNIYIVIYNDIVIPS